MEGLMGPVADLLGELRVVTSNIWNLGTNFALILTGRIPGFLSTAAVYFLNVALVPWA
jgi:hypothetical protein